MKALIGCLALLVMTTFGYAAEGVSKNLQLSFTVGGVNSSGSGVMVSRKRGNEYVHFLWTAAHVVDKNQQIRKGLLPKNFSNYEILYYDLNLVQEVVQDGRKVGAVLYTAEIVRLGSATFGEDLALLKLHATNIKTLTTEFAFDVPQVGQEIYHIGSIHGLPGSNTFSKGTIAAIGKIREKNQLYDQASIIATVGSSGCGIYMADGRCAGLVIEQEIPHMIFYKPARKMREWAQKHDCMWALESNIPVPSDDEIFAKRDKYIADIPGELAIPLINFLGFTKTK